MQHSSLWVFGGLAAMAAVGGALAWTGASETRAADAAAKPATKPAVRAKSKSSAAHASGPVALELFTSQGCSSCPPADALAARLARDPTLVVITRPVTYWDRLGWKDTLAQEGNTRLQRSYAQKGFEGAGVYTPQMVINGKHAAVGSRSDNIAMLVRDAKMEQRPVLNKGVDANGAVIVTLTGKFGDRAQMTLVALSSKESIAIGRGENGGRTVHYTNVLRAETALAPKQDAPSIFVVPRAQMQRKDADRYAVILRREASGPILAARML